VKAVIWGISRTTGTEASQKAPLLPSELKAMLEALPQSVSGGRDRALLLVGFCGAFRRSELVGLNVEDVARVEDGLKINLRRSKTDQEGKGRNVGLPFGSSASACPVRALAAWLEESRIETGAIFRGVNRHGRIGGRLTDRAVALIVKRAARLVGIEASRLAGHSLRAGLATAAAKAGKSSRSIMKQTGHRSERMVARYIRDASLFTENAAAGLF
jgi:integrase